MLKYMDRSVIYLDCCEMGRAHAGTQPSLANKAAKTALAC